MTDLDYMRQALELAGRAAALGEIPVGCVIVHHPSSGGPAIIGAGANRREVDCDPTAHAEIVALRQAAQQLKSWRLAECTLYVTLEPCPMCAGALVNARLPRLVYGCRDPKAGAVDSLYQLCSDPRLNHRIEICEGVLGEESAVLLRTFFSARRKNKLSGSGPSPLPAE